MGITEEMNKELERYANLLPRKKFICSKQKCISCPENDCENQKLIKDYAERLYIALAKTYSPVSAYIVTDRLK